METIASAVHADLFTDSNLKNLFTDVFSSSQLPLLAEAGTLCETAGEMTCREVDDFVATEG